MMDSSRRILKLMSLFLAASIVCTAALPLHAAISWGPPPEGSSSYETVFDISMLGVRNPQFTFDNDPEYGSITASFGTHLVGQTLGMSYNSLNETSPVAPLALTQGGPDVVTQWDNDASTKLMLGGIDGIAKYTTPLTILFDQPVSQVGFVLGHLDEIPPSTVIEAYDSSGASLGVLGDLPHGYSDLSIVDSDGAISGVSIYIPGDGLDDEGFGINSVVFSTGGVIPEPVTFLIWSLLGFASFSMAWHSRRSSG